MPSIEFVVTQKFILQGHRKDCFRCPVALAAQEVTGDDMANAGPCTIIWKVDGVEYEMETPGYVCEFMDRFDEGLPVEPITILLEAA